MESTGVYGSLFTTFLIGFIGGFLFSLYEKTSHERHLVKWSNCRKKGSFYFVTIHYVLGRAVPPAVLVALTSLWGSINAGVDSGFQFKSIFVLLVVTFASLGVLEWWKCQEECSVSSMKESAEEIKAGRSSNAITMP